jgi:nucleoside-diphosphate-sugar epimerase
VTTWAVTGGSGFIGRHLLRRLVADGHRVRSLDLEPLDLAGVEAIVGDVRDPDAVRRLCCDADVVVHAAAALPITGSRRELWSVNVDGTRTVLDAAGASDRLVVVSSGVVYGLQPPPVREDAAPSPIEPYGRAKLAAEELARAAGAVVLRPTAVVGPERRGLYSILCRWIDEGRRVYVLGSGRTRYQLLAIEDLVEAILLAAERGRNGEAYNLGATEVRTVREELETLIRRAGSSSTVGSLPALPARLALATFAAMRLSPLSPWHYRSGGRDVVLDVGKAAHELGWRPRFSNADALAATHRWLLEHRTEDAAGRTHRAAWPERALAFVRRLS